jgi:Putative DNA-binding domain
MKNNASIEEDFEHELAINQFPFQDVAVKSQKYIPVLFEEFSMLAPRPKFHLYFNDFISEEEWMKDRAESRANMPVTRSREIVAANFVKRSHLEIKAEDLYSDLTKMMVKKTVEQKYFGRFIIDMQTYKLLASLEIEFDHFKKYVFKDLNINNYSVYARAAAKKIILLTNKIKIPGLKLDLLEFLTQISTENDFKIMLWINAAEKHDLDQLSSNFSYLKTLADEIFNDEINKLTSLKTTPAKSKLDPKSFKNSKYSKMNCQQLIQQGEGKFIEFKRTLRIDLETNKPGNKAKQAIAKTLAAYLNSGGGALLIGVADNKEIIGLDADFNSIKKGDNHDNFQKCFDDLISTKFGSDFHHLD